MFKRREEVYNLYWYFAAERQNIFYNKLNNCEQEKWTNDPILKEYKFCNSYRASDRVSQYLIKNVIYNGNKYSDEDMIFRIILFKLFNKESTWELLTSEMGDIKLLNFDFNKCKTILEDAISNNKKIYNDAYISCANKAFGFNRKHENHLALLKKMFIEDNLAKEIISSKNMEEAFNYLRRYPLIGNFMAYQLITDINYSEVVDFKETEFTIVGPGSKRGIKKCFYDLGDMSEEEVIKWMYEHQEEEFKRLGIEFKKLGSRNLQYIDCQNLFCEVDKYCRAKIPDLKSNRVRIKKKYISKGNLEYFYPPKWNINLNDLKK